MEIKIKKIILAILLSLFLFTCYDTPKEVYRQHAIYQVVISNWIGSICYFCDKYELNLLTRTYKLFKNDGSFIAEITLTDGFIIRIEPNDYVK